MIGLESTVASTGMALGIVPVAPGMAALVLILALLISVAALTFAISPPTSILRKIQKREEMTAPKALPASS